MPELEQRYYNLKQIAKYLGHESEKTTLKFLIRVGIPFVKEGKSYTIDKNLIDDYYNEQFSNRQNNINFNVEKILSRV